MELALATANKGKLREIRQILEPLGFSVKSAAELGFHDDIIEDGDSFEANAAIKARTLAKALGRPAIADDSGLEVEALGGAPGIYSARYAGENGNDGGNNQKLLAELGGLPREKRAAAFVCVMCCAKPDGEIICRQGRLEGRIAFEPKGENGFGYDPLFELPNRGGLRAAELAPEEKNAISHRGKAMRALADVLKDFLL